MTLDINSLSTMVHALRSGLLSINFSVKLINPWLAWLNSLKKRMDSSLIAFSLLIRPSIYDGYVTADFVSLSKESDDIST